MICVKGPEAAGVRGTVSTSEGMGSGAVFMAAGGGHRVGGEAVKLLEWAQGREGGMALARKLSFTTNEAGNCAVAGLTVMVGSGNRAAVCMLGKGVRTTTKRADNESRWTTATVHVVAEPVAT